MERVTLVCFLASYLVALGAELVRTAKAWKTWRWPALIACAAGLVAHTAYLVVRSQQTDLPPLLASPHDWLLVLAWIGAVAYVAIVGSSKRIAVGPFLLPLIILTVLGASIAGSNGPRPAAAQHMLGMAHAATLVLGLAGIAAALVISVMFLVQHYRLRRKTPSAGLALPSLERLAFANRIALYLSVPMLGLGVVTGFLMTQTAAETSTYGVWRDPKILTYVVGWLILLALLVRVLRARHSPAREIAWSTILAAGFLLLAVVGLQALGGGGSAESVWHR